MSETTKHVEMLTTMQCDQAQGYLYSRPLKLPALKRFLYQGDCASANFTGQVRASAEHSLRLVKTRCTWRDDTFSCAELHPLCESRFDHMPTDTTRLKCFVIASPHDRRFEQLYQEIYDGAIRDAAIQDAELIPCRTTFDAAAKLSMETIVEDIAYCDACFADLSQESPYLWFAIGCALALGKPLCLVSSKNVVEEAPFALPQPGGDAISAACSSQRLSEA